LAPRAGRATIIAPEPHSVKHLMTTQEIAAALPCEVGGQ
jgi:hypothetical protein